ncbi:MAG: twin-arginine translocase TatA/TatE family subunit [Nannocystaceae bacterium]
MLLGIPSGVEIGIVVLILLLLFGPSKLPQLGSSVGKMLRGFKKEMRAISEDPPASEGGEVDVTPVDPSSSDS